MSEWITDREPTDIDAPMDYIIVWSAWNVPFIIDYRDWHKRYPWMPIEKPEPYVAPSYNFENQTDAPERHALPGLLAQHAALFPDSKPRPVRSITGTVTLGQPTTENFEFVEVEAFLRAKHGMNNDGGHE